MVQTSWSMEDSAFAEFVVEVEALEDVEATIG